MSELQKLRRQIKVQQEEIKRLLASVDYDSLTGLYNRRGFVREAEKFLNELKHSGKRKERRQLSLRDFSLIFIDLDNLKTLNDRFGHRFGDLALKKTANLLKNSIRDFDVIARWGGDEFVIGLVGVDRRNASEIAEKLREKMRAIKIEKQNLSASFGVSSALGKKQNVFNLYELIEKADLAMYEAKKNKRLEKNKNN
jgi:diguanylate cyclase (GGDEF)-like protein